MSVWAAAMCQTVTQTECKRWPISLNAYDANGNGHMISRKMHDRRDVLNGMSCLDDGNGGDDEADADANLNKNANTCGVDVRRPDEHWTR